MATRTTPASTNGTSNDDDLTNLAAFVVPEPPPPTHRRGRNSIWPQRFEALTAQCRGQWVDATAAWGTSKTASTGVLKRAKALGVSVETRVQDDHLIIRVQ